MDGLFFFFFEIYITVICINYRREVESDYEKSEYSFERQDSGRAQSKALRVQFTIEDNG